MQRGKRKSSLAGGSQPLDSSILYSRYTDLSAVLMDGEQAPASAAADGAPRAKKERKVKRKALEAEEGQQADAVNGAAAAASEHGDQPAAPAKQRKKPRWTDEQKAAARAEREAAGAVKKAKRQPPAEAPAPADGGSPAAAAAAPAASGGEEGQEGGEKKKKKKKKGVDGPVVLSPEERVSGPGNAEEAQRMRQALGFAPAKDVPSAAPAVAGKAVFSFGFGSGAGTQPSEAGAAAGAAKDDTGSSEEEESGEEEDSDSSDDEEESGDDEQGKQAAPKQAAPSSSSDDSDSSSSEEEQEEAAAPAAKRAASSSEASSSDSSSSDSDSDDEGGAGQGQGQQQGGEFVPRRVYVGGMPYGYTEDQIWEYWGYCGEIESLDLMTFPDTGRFRGIAFITFKTEEAYEAALACNGEQCDGQTLKVMKCRPSAKDRQAAQQRGPAAAQPFAPPRRYEAAGAEAAPQQAQQEQPGRQPWRQQDDAGAAPAPKRLHAGPAPKTPGYHVAYVGNVAYEADDKALARLFEPFGVTKVRLHTDKDTGKPKGFAHIHFSEEEGLDKAQALDGTSLLGRRIRVGYAQPKKGDGQ